MLLPTLRAMLLVALLGASVAAAPPRQGGQGVQDAQDALAEHAVQPRPTANRSVAVEAMIVVRSSPLAGFQFHAGDALFTEIRVGDRLALVREPDNPHDANAVRVEWRQVKLGYVPRRDNPQVARQIDLGAALEARVSKLREARNPWDRVEFEVVLVLQR